MDGMMRSLEGRGRRRRKAAVVFVVGVLSAGVASGCGYDALGPHRDAMPDTISRSTLQVGAGLPESWPEQVTTIPGFEIQYSTIDESAQGRSMMVQFYSQFPRWGACSDYVDALSGRGFEVVEGDEAAGWWRLKGHGMEVEVMIDVSMTDEMRVAVVVTGG
jgi:hypothetical protein